MDNIESIEIIIRTKTNKDKIMVGEKLHNNLRGKQPYIDIEIGINIDNDYEVLIWCTHKETLNAIMENLD